MDPNENRQALDSLLSNVVANTRKKREARKARNTGESWRKIWEDALREFYPECLMTYGTNTAVHLKRMVSHYGLPQSDMPTFLPWIVKNWQTLRITVFSFNGRAYGPEVPDMKWVVRNMQTIHAKFTATKPGVANSLPLAERAHARDPAPAPSIPAKPKNAPAANPAPMHKPLAPHSILAPLRIDYAKAAETRKRLNLKKWD